MKAKPTTAREDTRRTYVQPYRYPSPNIPLSAIKRFARQIADKFHPEKIILFGSYAYGTPHDESDVDLLVIMPTQDARAKARRIAAAFDRPFSLDLIVRTPKQIERGLRPDDRDWFLCEIVERGLVLYEAPHCSVGPEGRGGRTIAVGNTTCQPPPLKGRRMKLFATAQGRSTR